MTDRAQIEQVIRAAYAARCAGDIEGALKHFTDDTVFTMNARGIPVEGAGDPVAGKAAVGAALADLIKTWKFDDWRILSLVVEGDKAALHWQADVTNNSTSKRAPMDGFDIVSFRDGKVADFRQSADTALMVRLATT